MSLNNVDDVLRSKRIWYYDRTDFDALNNVISNYNWDAITDLKSI
jgi:hypothetical protein